MLGEVQTAVGWHVIEPWWLWKGGCVANPVIEQRVLQTAP